MDGQEVNVVADNTDVLILLMHHWRDSMADVHILSEPKSTSKKGLQVWRIRDLVAKARTLVVSHLLFLHAWSGCDSASAIPLDKLRQNMPHQEDYAADVFIDK